MEVGDQRHAPAALPPGKRLNTHYVGSPRVGLEGYPLGLDPRAVQSVASRYTDWATPAHFIDVDKASDKNC